MLDLPSEGFVPSVGTPHVHLALHFIVNGVSGSSYKGGNSMSFFGNRKGHAKQLRLKFRAGLTRLVTTEPMFRSRIHIINVWYGNWDRFGNWLLW